MHLPPLLLCLLAAHALARKAAPPTREIPTLQYLKPKSNRSRLIDQRAAFYGEGDRLNPGAARRNTAGAGSAARRGRYSPKQTIEEVSLSLADVDMGAEDPLPEIGVAHGHEVEPAALEALEVADARREAEEDAMLMAHREVDDAHEVRTVEEAQREERALRKREKEHERALMDRDGPLGLAEEISSYARAKRGVRQRRRKQGKGKARTGKGGAVTAGDRAKAKAEAMAKGVEHVTLADHSAGPVAHDSTDALVLDSTTAAAAAVVAAPVAAAAAPVLAPGQYASCQTHRYAIGYARFPGWRLDGDEMSGAVPVTPEMACVSACTHYGEACTGVAFSPSSKTCQMKGVNIADWKFLPSAEADVVALAGGCEAWAAYVPAEMALACCDA